MREDMHTDYCIDGDRCTHHLWVHENEEEERDV